MSGKISRRQFLRRAGLSLAAGAAVLGGSQKPVKAAEQPVKGPAPVLVPRAYIPAVYSQPADVVRVHSEQASAWDFNYSTWYGDYVNQTKITEMMESGLKEVTGTATPREAWAALLPGYAPGKKIVVKVNLNNAKIMDDTDAVIDALPQVALGLLKTLCTDFGVDPQDVMIYDAQRAMPGRFYNPVHAAFGSVGLFDNGTGYGTRATFDLVDPSLRIVFSQPNLVGERRLTDLLFYATYVINIPIMKKHGTHPVTLGFKNHFGSTDKLREIAVADDNLHPYINPNDLLHYNPSAIPFVDINNNPNIRNKTVLTIGDGMFGSTQVGREPEPWPKTFGAGKAPNSLFFSRDAVAVDCVMCDVLRDEFGFDIVYPGSIATFPEGSAYQYLQNAEARGMGRFQSGSPALGSAGYTKFKYKVVEL